MRLSNQATLALIAFLVLVIADIYVYKVAAQRRDHFHHIYFLDVGQGDSILIRTAQGENILVDGGPDGKSADLVRRYLPFWDTDIDLMVLTHAHADHATGLLEIVRTLEVKNFWYSGAGYQSDIYNQLIATVVESGIPVTLANVGDKFILEQGEIQALYPVVEKPVHANPNELSIVTKLSLQDFDLLLTGDIGVDTESQIAPLLSDVEVLKVAHQGSRFSSSELFLERSSAEVGVISVGADNTYGHPNPEVLNRLADRGMTVYRTDHHGTVHLLSDGSSYKILTDK